MAVVSDKQLPADPVVVMTLFGCVADACDDARRVGVQTSVTGGYTPPGAGTFG